MYATNFHDDILGGMILQGGRISNFPIDFCMSLTTWALQQ